VRRARAERLHPGGRSEREPTRPAHALQLARLDGSARTRSAAGRVPLPNRRDVWAPSLVTESSFANVQAAWPYRASLDCVVEAPDGRFAAYCLIWPDDENRVGELEPVGVREEFRRRGLGSAVCTFALRRLHEEGGRQAIVYCATDAACGLYESIGFRRHATAVGYSRSSFLSNAPNARSS
jgi:ribosomal protein S18 acetylase RimI-like enzyme